MISTCLSFILMGVAFIVTTLVYPYVLAFARRHNIVDNPSARKLQRVPVPVMGGTAVFIGIIVAVATGMMLEPDERLIKIIGLLVVMFLVGVWDDIKDVPASLRFLLELGVVWLMILILGVEINNFHGLWGVYELPDAVSVPLSLIAGVGIMNAINLIDGVDGYCSTYGVMACSAFAIIFFYAGDMGNFALALVAIGAFVPFFFHNVFGRSSKMFLGDGGSLMLGTLLAYFTFSVLTAGSPTAHYDYLGLSLPAVCLAILAVPVFDTLRVMIVRVARGVSPFHPDKTHLHHLFIDMNFSHLFTSAIIVMGNILIEGILLITWALGLSIDWQTYLVILCSLSFTWLFYFVMDKEHRKHDGNGSELWQRWCKHGKATNLSRTPFWLFVRKVVDSRFLGAGFVKTNVAKPEGPVVMDAPKKRLDPRVGSSVKDQK